MGGVVGPCRASIQTGAMARVEIVPVNEVVVDDHAVVPPAGMPPPPPPAPPPPPQKGPHGDSHAKSEVRAPDERSVRPIRIRITKGRAPYVARIIIRQVHHLRI